MIIQKPEIPDTLSEENITITTTQQQAILGQPVKWTKHLSLDNPNATKIILPKHATNISVNKLSTISTKSYSEDKGEGVFQNKTSLSQEKSLSSSEIPEAEDKQKASFTITGAMIGAEQGNFLARFFKNLGQITGRAIDIGTEIQEVEIHDTATEYTITYETPAPEISLEQNIGRGKRIKISSPENIHYENVLAFTDLDESLNIKNPSQIKIHWIEQNSYISIKNLKDRDNNGIYDYVEFIAPSLSEQTFEIIVITKAEHLDENRNFISNIYEEVKELDRIWSEEISDTEYVRVTFEIPLDSSRDITLYPRVVSGTPRIEIYEIGENEKIAEFTNLNPNEYNKIFLTNLEGTQDTFDLKIVGGSLEIEHIIDPPVEQLENPSFTLGSTSWTLSSATYSSTTYQDSEGSMQVYAPRKGATSGTATQDDYDDYLSTDTVNFSCYWSNTHAGNGNIVLYAEIAEDSTPTSWTEIWTSGTLYSSNSWTSTGNQDVSSNFNDGTYRLRLRIEADGGAGTGSEEYGWFDNCHLYKETANTAPTISGLPDVEDDEDFGTNNSVMDLWDYSSDSEDVDADLTYAIESESSVATVDCGIYDSHYINCTSQANATGYSDVTVSVTDTGAASDTDVFRFTVNAVNDPPWSDSIANPGNIDEDSEFNDNIVSVTTINTAFRDIEDDQLLTNCTIDSETDTTAVDCEVDGSYNVDCTTQANQSGSNTVTLNCCDSGDLCTNMDSFTVTVDAVNDNPWNEGLSNPGNVNEDTGFHDNVITKATLDTTFRDVEEDQVPTNYAISEQTGSSIINCVIDGEHNIDCTTQANQSGSNTVTLNLSDSGSLYTEPTFTITVNPINDPPWVDGLSNPANLSYNSGLNQDVISSTNMDNNFRDVENDQSPTTVEILSETHTEIVDCTLNGHALDCTTQANQYGTSTVTLNYTDSGGLWATDSIDVSITPDTILPTPLFGTDPINTYNDSDGSIIFKLKCFDDDGLDTLQLWGNWTGTWHANQTNSTPINDTIWSIQVNNIPEGKGYIWGVYCNDSAGNKNWTSVNRTFTVDSTAPTTTLPVYTNATQYRDDQSMIFNISVSDSGTSPSYCSVNVAGNTNQTVSVSSGWCNGTYALTGIGDGNQTINAYANDTLGNTALNDSYVVWLDSTEPTITHNAPANDTYFNYAPYFNGTCSDSGVGLHSIYTNLTEYNAVDDSSPYNFTNTSSLTNSLYSVRINCNDSVNNTATSDFYFTFDATAPSATINAPGNNTNTTDTTPDINITLTDNIGTSINYTFYINDTANKTGIVGNNSPTNITMNALAEGKYRIKIQATDNASNIANSSEIWISIDKTGPSMSNEGSNETEINQSGYFCLNITVTDPIGIDTVYAEIWNTTDWVNYTMNEDGTSCDGTASDGIYGVEIQGDIVGIWNYSQTHANDSLNNWNSYDFSDLTINVTSSNQEPTIDWVESIDPTNPTDDSTTSITFNFTVPDENGCEDINVSSVNASFIRAGEPTRINESCVNYSQSGNDINFTCTIDMWYFDQNGAWTINVSIQDNEGEYAENSSTTFTYNVLPGMKMSPTSLNWPEVNLTDTDTGSNEDPIIINNTGNSETLNINITSYNLRGEEITTQYIFANNFTVSNESQGCGGTTMSNASSINVTSAILHRGNHSLNYNNATSGQEQIYFCLKGVPQDISSQSYSSSAYGAWEIRILLVAVMYARRRKKKRKKLKKNNRILILIANLRKELVKDFSKEKEILISNLIKAVREEYKISRKDILNLIEKEFEIPVKIFTSKLGALEAITKYMKENLNMGYKEIAERLNRDQRTIWTAYSKAVEKQKKPFEIKKAGIIIPLSAFKKDKLTILESIVVYLKRKNKKFVEIAELIERDQRNIWTIYSKAKKKLNNKK